MLLNQLTVEGRTGKDPETKSTQAGKNLTKTSIAVYQGKDKPALWLNLTGWDKMSEVLAETKKGDPIVVTGELVQECWKDKDGNDRTALGVNVRGFSWGNRPAREAPPAGVDQVPW